LQLASSDFPESDHIFCAQDASRLILTGFYKDKIIGFKIWDLNTQALRRVGRNAMFLSVNHIVVQAVNSEHLRILNTDNYPPSLVVEHPVMNRVWNLYLSPDTTLLASDRIEYGFQVYKLPEFKTILERQGNFLCFSPDNLSICYEKIVSNKIMKEERVIVMEKIKKSPNMPSLVLRLSGETLKETFCRVNAACYSHDQKYLLYCTTTGAAIYHFEAKKTLVLKFPWAPPREGHYDFGHTSADSASFSPDDKYFVVGLTSNHESSTVIYRTLDFKISQVIRGNSKEIVFVPNQPNVFIRLTRLTTEGWNLEGRMLHRFYTLGIPDSLSVFPENQGNTHRAIITDEHSYAYILSPHNPSLQKPEELQKGGMDSLNVRLRDRPLPADAARILWEMRDYPTDYLFYWKYMFPGDRGHAFPLVVSDDQPIQLVEDKADKTMYYMCTLVGEMEDEIRKINHSVLANSFSGVVEKFPGIHATLEKVFMKFTEQVNLLVMKDMQKLK
jgi:hypothetical protein